MALGTRPRAVFFDAVGTLLFPDPPAESVYASVAARHGLRVDPESISRLMWERFQFEEEVDRHASWATSEERERNRWRNVVSAALPGASDSTFEELLHHFAQPTSWRVAIDAAGTLAALNRAGFLLGIGSNFDARLCSVVEGTPALQLASEHVIVSSLIGVRKPGIEFFRTLAHQARCPVEEVVYVGDDPANDYFGAASAGLPAVLVDPHNRYTEIPNRVGQVSALIGRLAKPSVVT